MLDIAFPGCRLAVLSNRRARGCVGDVALSTTASGTRPRSTGTPRDDDGGSGEDLGRDPFVPVRVFLALLRDLRVAVNRDRFPSPQRCVDADKTPGPPESPPRRRIDARLALDRTDFPRADPDRDAAVGP